MAEICNDRYKEAVYHKKKLYNILDYAVRRISITESRLLGDRTSILLVAGN